MSDTINDNKIRCFVSISTIFAFVYSLCGLRSIRCLIGDSLTLSSIILAMLGIFLTSLPNIKRGSFIRNLKKRNAVLKKLKQCNSTRVQHKNTDYLNEIVKLIKIGINSSILFIILNIVFAFIPEKISVVFSNNIKIVYIVIKFIISFCWLYLLIMMIWNTYYLTRIVISIVQLNHYNKRKI